MRVPTFLCEDEFAALGVGHTCSAEVKPTALHVERVLVTGVGVISSIGLGKTAFFRSLEEGRNGISPVTSFDASTLGRTLGGEVHGFEAGDHLTRAESRNMGRCSAMAVAAARMATKDAELEPGALASERTSVVLGTTMGEARILAELDRDWILSDGEGGFTRAKVPRYGSTLLSIHVARAMGARGMVLTLPAACAAGNYALCFAAELIRSGRSDVVIAGAAELLQELQFSGFVRLAAMAPEKCQPFDLNRQGLLLGEGAGILVLESSSHAERRGARPQAELGGSGLSCDAYHITRPQPDALGSIAAMRDAIARSGIAASDLDFVNAHGTGTKHNDAAEAKVVREVFGGRRIPISSMKSMLGHCMGAASALEAIGCVFTIETGIYPPTIGYETRDPDCDLNVVANVAARGPSDVVLNNALAFGGYNAVTIMAKPGVLPPPEGRPQASR
jgi:3-oxoacyl-[acyl-carrier-protein] synthase II